MIRPVRVVALLGVFAGNTAAQAVPPSFAFARARLVQEANGKLRSADLATAAWGAHAAAESRLVECIPELRARLASLTIDTGDARRCAVSALLDALIETDAVVPGDEVAPFLGFRTEAVVLLARRSDSNRALLLRLFRPANVAGGEEGVGIDDEVLACGNLLANLRDAAFVRELLRVPLEVWVTVVDHGAEVEPADAGISVGYACGRFPVPKGFPRMARHQLGTGDGPAQDLVAMGPQPVFRFRSWYRAGLHCHRFSGYSDYSEARAGWLRQLLGEKHWPLIAAIDRPRVCAWQGDEAVRAFAEQCRIEAERDWRALVAACAEAKLLVGDGANEPPPRITVAFIDNRQDQKVPLPDLRKLLQGKVGR